MSKRIVLSGILILTPSLMAGCLPSKFEEKVEEAEQDKIQKQEMKKETPPDIKEIEEMEPSEVELSEEQLKTLEEGPQISPEEAVKNNQLEQQVEIEPSVPKEKESYTTAEEASQYISYLFYQYHTKQIDGKTFYSKLKPHMDQQFLSLLPEKEEYRVRTFEVLQEEFSKQLPSPIMSYKTTMVNTDERTKETTFYRMYEMKNKVRLYFITVMNPTDKGQWLITDDRPAPPYVVQDAQQKFQEGE